MPPSRWGGSVDVSRPTRGARRSLIQDPGLRVGFGEHLVELGRDRGLVIGLQDPGLGLHDLAQRPEADSVPVRKAPPLAPGNELGELIDVTGELAHEPRLAEPRLSDDRDELGRGTGSRSDRRAG